MRLQTALLSALLMIGCANPSVESGSGDRDASAYEYGSSSGSAASLVEVTFGGGEAEVTKNLPGQAMQGVEDAVKARRGKQPPDVSGSAR